MVWLFVIVIVAVIGLFIWAHFKVKADEERLLEEDPSALYPFFGEFTSRCIYTTSTFEKDVILVNSDTGKIYIGGRTYNMSDITQCGSMVHDGHVETIYEDKTYIKTNIGSAIGRAIVGGAVAGGVGTIIGASTANKEIKTKRVAKHTYVGKTNSLYLEVNNSPQMVNVHAKSEDELWDVTSFINNELTEYNTKRKKIQEKIDKEKKEKEEEEQKVLEKEELVKLRKEMSRFIVSPFEFSVKEIAKMGIRYGNDMVVFSEKCNKIFSEEVGVYGLNYFQFKNSSVVISTETESYKEAIENIVNLKKYLINLFGLPQSDLNIESIESNISNNRTVSIKWHNDWECSLSSFADSKSKYHCNIVIQKT